MSQRIYDSNTPELLNGNFEKHIIEWGKDKPDRLQYCVGQVVDHIQAKPTKIKFETWEETCAIADSQIDDWLIPDWAEFGACHLISGREKAGKSSIIADIIADMSTGKEWAGKQITPSPFILLDFENREKVIIRRIRAALGEDQGRIAELYRRIPPKQIPRPITPKYIVNCIDTLKRQIDNIGTNKCVVFADTFRSAFLGTKGKENDNDDMRDLLYPFTELAHEYCLALFILHHDTKSGAGYAGAGAIGGCVDHIWHWESSPSTFEGKLSLMGRGDPQYPMLFKYDFDLRRNIYCGDSAEVKDQKAKERKRVAMLEWLAMMGTTKETAKSKADILSTVIVIKGLEFKDANKTGVQRRTQECYNAELLSSFEGSSNSNGGRPTTLFYVNDKGLEMLKKGSE